MEKPLYKIWEELSYDKIKKLSYEFSEDEKNQIYLAVKNSMMEYNIGIYLYNLKNPFVAKKWLEKIHHVKCSVIKKQMINGPTHGYQDTHYCHITWG